MPAEESSHAPPNQAVVWLQKTFGPCRLEVCGSQHARSQVWRVWAEKADSEPASKLLEASGKSATQWQEKKQLCHSMANPETQLNQALPLAYLKLYASERSFAQANHAYTKLANAELPAKLPCILAREDSMRGLLLSPCLGDSIAGYGSAEQHRAAGSFLAAMHRLPLEDTDPMPLRQALQKRCAATTRAIRERAAGSDEAMLAERVDTVLAEILPRLATTQRVFCHLDFVPRNWLWNEELREGSLSVIDFEHAKPDLWLADMARIQNECWRHSPALADAFWDGYGAKLSRSEQEIFDACGVLEAWGTVAWGLQADDAVYLEKGRANLAYWVKR